MIQLQPIQNFFKTAILFLFILGCEPTPPIELQHLSGYWEIAYVEQNGEQFIPKVGQPLYDFYYFDQTEGIRKKVAPKFDGSYQTSDDQTSFELQQKEGRYLLQFKTPWDTWSEQIVYLDSTKLVLFHLNYNYHYIRP